MLANSRRIIALIILSFFITGFILPFHGDWSFWVARIQFVPSYVGLEAGEAGALLIFLALLLLTLLFGRVFCSWICPLGILQDLAHRLSHPSGRYKKSQARYTPHHWILRGSILLLTVGALILGSNFVLSWLDPYSISARFGTALLQPLAQASYEWLGYSERTPDWSRYSPLILSLIAASVLIPLVMAFFKGRLYCNSICPVGTLLGWISRVAPFTPALKNSRCIRCMRCTTYCKAHAIDIKNLRIDPTRCVACYDCVAGCDSGVISLTAHNPFRAPIQPAPRPSKKKPSSPPTPKNAPKDTPEAVPHSTPDTSRRALIGLGLTGMIGTLLPSCKPSAEEQDAAYESDPSRVGNNHMRAAIPPGAGSLPLFLDRCTGCSLCITACPTQVLKPSLMTLGWEGINKPYLDFNDAACAYSCHLCATTCPEGAIQELPLAVKQRTQIGLANVNQTRCIVWQDHKECVKCVTACPTKALKQKDVSIPHIDLAACVGCNTCVEICPVKTISLQTIQDGAVERKIAVINFANCIGCGECSYSCPHNAIECTDLVAPDLEEELCIGCGACIPACPARPQRATSVTPRAKQILLKA